MRLRIALTLACLLLTAAVAYGQLPDVNEKAGVVGTVHDLTAASSGEACATCHSVHGARADADLLWARAIGETTFTTYDSASLTVAGANSITPGAITQEEYASYLCLSCHDEGGVPTDTNIATGGNTVNASPFVKDFPGIPATGAGGVDDVNTFPVRNDTTPPSPLPTGVTGVTTFLTGQLEADHPVNIEYSATNALLLARGDAETAGVKFFDTSLDVPTVQCGSCHNPHELNYAKTTGPDATWSNRTFFIRSRLARGEDLCLACHL